MKKLQTPLFLMCLSLLFAAASCKKEEEPKHRDVVTATINGKPWKAECKESPPFGCNIADLQYYTNTGGFSLRATNLDDNVGIRIRLFEVFSQGIYSIPAQQNCGGITLETENCKYWQFFIIEQDTQEIHIIDINHDSKIIEGTFHFIGRDTNFLSEPIYVTNGYFKVKYRP